MKYTAILLLCISIVACEKQNNTGTTSTYKNNGISFTFLNNWKVTEDVNKTDLRHIYIEDPEYSMLTIQIYSIKEALNLNDYVKWYSEYSNEKTLMVLRLTSTYSNITSKNNTKPIKGIREHLSASQSITATLPYIREYFRIRKSNKVAFIICQAAKEDFNKVKAGFELIIRSFSIE